MLKTALVRRLADAPSDLLRWTLDLPANSSAVDVSAGELRVQGWMLLRAPGAAAPAVVVRGADATQGEVQRHPFNCGRPDVIDRVLQEPSAGHPQARCGFRFSLPVSALPVEVGFQWGDNEPFWAASISLQEVAMQVIEGADGWLFLDNDTNRSVDQYTGELLLDPAGLRLWRSYLAECRALAARHHARHALVVAPSKEEVLRRHYPHTRAATTVLDQVRALTRAEDHFVDGAVVLAAQPEPEQMFMRTDTHWTDRGAMLTMLAVLHAMGLDTARARERLAGDTYRVAPYTGDLGLKLVPQRTAPTEFLAGPASEAGAVLDNRLPNIGRVLVFENGHINDQMLCEGPLLMFGASSAYPMLKYLKRLFGRVVFVHSAGHVDPSIVDHERPSALLLQSNGRFLIQPPRADFSLASAVRTKLAEAGEPARRHASQLLAQGPHSALDLPYLDMLKVAA
jgi:alginate O-acetyltransferase complex protein AlgJ